MAVSKFLTLASGHSIPTVGLGVYQTPAAITSNIVYEALKLGYRHIDSAQVYKNEQEVVDAISKWLKEDPVNNKREDVFYTTKIARAKDYESAAKAIEQSIQIAEPIGYIDLFLMHSPFHSTEIRMETWRALEDAQLSGRVKTIGVSNFGIHHLQQLLSWDKLRVKPAVNQVELSPWLMRRELIDYMRKEGIVPEAYSPLTRGTRLDDPTLVKLAEKYGKTPAQVLIRWSLQSGFVVLPKTEKVERLASNLDVFSFDISQADMEELQHPDSYSPSTWDPTVWPLDSN